MRGGEYKEQVKSFGELGIVMGISIAMIFMALVIQFKNAVKPLLVFAAIPFGMVGAFAALWIMGSPFGFIAFLGVATSLASSSAASSCCLILSKRRTSVASL